MITLTALRTQAAAAGLPTVRFSSTGAAIIVPSSTVAGTEYITIPATATEGHCTCPHGAAQALRRQLAHCKHIRAAWAFLTEFNAWIWAGEPTAAERDAELTAWIWAAPTAPAQYSLDFATEAEAAECYAAARSAFAGMEQERNTRAAVARQDALDLYGPLAA